MKDKIFIDSNIFLYAFNNNDSKKQQIASSLILQENIDSFISVQVVNEVSNNMLKKLNFNNDEIREFIEDSYERFFL
jgi:predicted nucleic acid-binding protein